VVRGCEVWLYQNDDADNDMRRAAGRIDVVAYFVGVASTLDDVTSCIALNIRVTSSSPTTVTYVIAFRHQCCFSTLSRGELRVCSPLFVVPLSLLSDVLSSLLSCIL